MASDDLITLGEFDNPTFQDECPVCGADGEQMCSRPDDAHEGLGIEMSNQVHAARFEHFKENPIMTTKPSPLVSSAVGQSLRLQALILLKQAQELDGLSPYNVTHRHSHGYSSYVGWFPTTPSQDEMLTLLEEDFEPERDEGLEAEPGFSLEAMTGSAANGVDTNIEAPQDDGVVISAVQTVVLNSYGAGDFAHLSEIQTQAQLSQELRECGDGLLKFLMVELAEKEDCGSPEEALRRVQSAIRQLDEVAQSIELMVMDDTIPTPKGA